VAYLFDSLHILEVDLGLNCGSSIKFAVKAAHPASSVSPDRKCCPVLISGTAKRARTCRCPLVMP